MQHFKVIFLLFFFIAIANNVAAQSTNDSVRVENKRYYYHNKKIAVTKLYDVVSKNAESRKEMRKATAYSIASGIFAGVGILNIFYPLGMVFVNSQLYVVNIGVGVAIVGLSIPFAIANKKHLKKAIKNYNSAIKPTGYLQPNFKLNFAYNSIGIKCTF